PACIAGRVRIAAARRVEAPHRLVVARDALGRARELAERALGPRRHAGEAFATVLGGAARAAGGHAARWAPGRQRAGSGARALAHRQVFVHVVAVARVERGVSTPPEREHAHEPTQPKAHAATIAASPRGRFTDRAA